MKKQKIHQLTACALMTALLCILGPMSIPIGPIPVSLTNFVIFLAVYILGMKGGTISYILYLLLGTVGLPVFSGFQGGLAKLTGPTGGFLIGFIFSAVIAGFVMERSHLRTVPVIIGMIAAMAVAYSCCVIWFCFQMQCDVWYALTTCVFPFVIIDFIKIVIVTIIGKTIRSALKKAGLLSAEKDMAEALANQSGVRP